MFKRKNSGLFIAFFIWLFFVTTLVAKADLYLYPYQQPTPKHIFYIPVLGGYRLVVIY